MLKFNIMSATGLILLASVFELFLSAKFDVEYIHHVSFSLQVIASGKSQRQKKFDMNHMMNYRNSRLMNQSLLTRNTIKLIFLSGLNNLHEKFPLETLPGLNNRCCEYRISIFELEKTRAHGLPVTDTYKSK